LKRTICNYATVSLDLIKQIMKKLALLLKYLKKKLVSSSIILIKLHAISYSIHNWKKAF